MNEAYVSSPVLRITRGATYTILFKLNENSFIRIENEKVQDFIDDNDRLDIERLSKNNKEVFEFLIHEQMIIKGDPLIDIQDTQYLFEKTDMVQKNGIIDINTFSTFCIEEIIRQYYYLGFSNLQIRFIKEINQEYLVRFLTLDISQYIGISIELIIPYVEGLYIVNDTFDPINYFYQYMVKNRIIRNIILYNSPYDTMISNFYINRFIYFTSQNCGDIDQCGKIDLSLFSQSTEQVVLNKNHNTCLYNKLSVDCYGNIKSCPSLSESFGNVSFNTLQEVFQASALRKLWHISKSQIEVCKICEYREICTDCRAYLKDPTNIYSKPLKCTYNPLTGSWNG